MGAFCTYPVGAFCPAAPLWVLFPSHRARCYAHSVEQCLPKPCSLEAEAHRQLKSVTAFLGLRPGRISRSLCVLPAHGQVLCRGYGQGSRVSHKMGSSHGSLHSTVLRSSWLSRRTAEICWRQSLRLPEGSRFFFWALITRRLFWLPSRMTAGLPLRTLPLPAFRLSFALPVFSPLYIGGRGEDGLALNSHLRPKVGEEAFAVDKRDGS